MAQAFTMQPVNLVSRCSFAAPARPAVRARLSPVRAEASTNTVAPVAEKAAAAEKAPERKPAPLARGGTLSGEAAAGKDAGTAAKASVAGTSTVQTICQIQDGRFVDYRWKSGTWVLSEFEKNGKMDWDAVIDAELARRRLLEQTPIPSTNEEPVLFDTGAIPWWAWVRRFHLPEAEKLNGRACMVGYASAWLVDSLTGAGLVDQQNSFLGKLLLHVVVFGVLLVRNQDTLRQLRGLLDEATFYDKQWNATWEGVERPSETQKTQ